MDQTSSFASNYVVVVIGKGVAQSIPVGQEAGDQDHDECGYPVRPSRQVGGCRVADTWCYIGLSPLLGSVLAFRI